MSSQLFTPFRLGQLKLPNRIVISPMCMYSAEEGNATDWHLIHLGSLAFSGAGLLVIEATAVSSEGRITGGCLGLYSDTNEQALGRVLDGVRRYSNMPIAVQLAHAGRKASSLPPWLGGQLQPMDDGGWQPVAPSAVADDADEPAPAEMVSADINRIRDAFVDSARRAARLDINAVELHFAHGYLLHEFLSPLANRRTDRYGGSLENRMRLPLEVFDAVRDAWPHSRPLGVRISATDWVDGGWDLEQSCTLGSELKGRGCDWIDVSSGGLSPTQKIQLGPGYQVPLARRLRAEVGLPTIAVGLITEAQQAETIIADGDADLVALARGVLWNPHWPWQAAGELGAQVDAPPQYWRAPPREFKQLFRDGLFGMR
ncbi:MAG: oxidoreductase [Gammaproteobacteria bacterium]|nr:MAG: oxidoreductase [Gammaproteobacteria bacterium]